MKVANSTDLEKQIKIVEEGKIMKQLDHPNIVKCFDVFEPSDEDPKAFIVMELMSTSLRDILNEYGRIKEQTAKKIFHKIV